MASGRISKGLCVLALATALGACSESPRQAKFHAIGKANKAIGEELKNPTPSLDAIRENAAKLDELATQLPSWFPAGSGPESGTSTEALPAIWQKPDAFKKAAGNFAGAAHALKAAAAGSDVAQIQAAAKAVGPTCKGCHEQFRQKK